MIAVPRSLRRTWRHLSRRFTPLVGVVATGFLCLLGAVAFGVLAANLGVTASNADQAEPGVPGRPAVTEITPALTELSMAFDAPGYPGSSAITTYEYSTDNGATWRARATGTTASPLVVTAASSDGAALTPDTAYTVRVRAVNEVGVGLVSNASATRTLPDRPGSPTSVSAAPSPTSVGAIDLTWTAPTTGETATAYDVRRSASADMASPTDTASATTTTSYTATGLTGGTTYWFQVRARSDTGKVSDWAPLGAVSAGAATSTPFAPASVSCSPSGTTNAVGSLSCAFTPPFSGTGGAITGYRHSTDGGTTWVDATGTTSPITITSQSDGQPLVNGFAYTAIEIAAVNAGGTGPASAQASATPSGVPLAPWALRAVAGDASGVLTWAAQPGAYLSGPTTSGHVTTPEPVGSTTFDRPNSVAALVALDDWTPTAPQAIAAKYTGTEATSSWELDVTTTGHLELVLYSSASVSLTSTAAVPAADGQPLWVKADRVVADGSTSVTFSTSVDGSTWTPLGDVVTVADPLTPNNGTGPLTVGSRLDADTGNRPVSGKISRVTVMTNGVTVADFDLRTRTTPTNADATVAGGAGETWTVTMGATGASRARILLTTGGSPITGHRVTATPSEGAPATDVVGPTATTTTVGGLTNGTAYTFVVAALNANGEGAQSRAAIATPLTPPDSPTSVVATQGDALVALSWAAPASGTTPTAYDVRWSTSSTMSSPTTIESATTSTGFTVTGLTNSTTYHLQVRARAALSLGAWSPVTPVSARPVAPPGAPTAITATQGDASALVAWTAPASGTAPTAYDLRWSTSSTMSSPTTTESATSTTSFTVTGLTNATEYFVQVRPRAGISAGSWWPVTPVSVTPVTPPGDPTSVTATQGNASALVSWVAPASGTTPTAYDVRWSMSSSMSSPTTRESATSTTSFTVTGLTNSTTYYVQVRPRANLSVGSWWPTTPVSVTPVAPPGAPTSITAVRGDASALVSWTAPASGTTPTAYDVRWSTSSTMSSPTTTESATATTSYTLTGLTNGTIHYVQVRPRANLSVGSWSPVTPVSVTPVTPPGAPTAITATQGDASALVSWTAPASGTTPTAYDVRWSTSSTMSSPTTTESATATTSFTVTGLTNSTEHFVQVRPRANLSLGSWSPVTPVSVTPVAPPGEPTAITATQGDASALVSWTAPASGTTPTAYDVRWSTSSAMSSPTTVASASTTTSYTITSLTNATTYHVQVRARAGVSLGSWSPVTPVTVTPVTPPGAPTSVTAVRGDASALVSWTAPASGTAPTAYDVRWSTSSTMSSPTTTESATTTTSYTLTGLTNGTIHYVQVRPRANLSVGSWWPVTPVSVTPVTPPGEPTAITTTQGDASAVVAWTAPASGTTPTAYDVRWSTSPTMSSPTTVDSATSSRTYTITGLTNSTTYHVQVRSRTGVSLGSWSPATPVSVTPVAPPSAPTDLTATVRDAAVELSWTAPSSGTTPTAYDVRRSTSSSMSSPTTVESATTSPGYTVTGLTNGTTYWFQVRPRAGGSIGSWSPATAVSAQPVSATPTFANATAYTASGGAAMSDAAVGDMNGDGKLDMVVVNDPTSATVSVFLGDGAGGFGTAIAAATGLTNLISVDLGDFDKDGDLDVVTTRGTTPEAYVISNNGGTTPTFATPSTISTGTSGRQRFVTVADFNSDGYADFATAVWGDTQIPSTVAGKASVVLSTGSGFAAATQYTTGASPVGIATGDVNNDGKPDLVTFNRRGNASSSSATVLTNDGSGSFTAANVGMGTEPDFGAVADLNGDGYGDLVAAKAPNTSALTVGLNDGTGTVFARTSYSVNSSTWQSAEVLVADFNGDGPLDVIVGTTSGGDTGLDYFAGNGDGTVKAVLRLSGTVGAFYSGDVGDANGDGRPDIFLSTYGISPQTTAVAVLNTTSGWRSPPSGVTATSGDASALVSWVAPSSGTAPTAYDVRWSTSSSMSSPTVVSSATTSTSYAISGLTNGTTYHVQVRSRTGTSASPWSPTTAVSVVPAVLPLTATPGDTSVALSWPAPVATAPTAYDVRWSTSSSMSSPTVVESATTTTSYTVTGLTNGTAYWFQFRSRTDATVGDWSPATPVSATPNAVAQPPTAVVGAAGSDGATLSWTAPSSGPTPSAYDVRRSTSPSMSSAVETASATTSSTSTFTGLSAQTPYYLQVRTRTASGQTSAWAPATPVTVTPYTRPSAPSTAPTLTYGGGDGIITATITTVTSGTAAAGFVPVAGYTVTFSPGGSTCTIAQTTAATASCTVSGLTVGTQYTATYVVRSDTNPAQSSPASPGSAGRHAAGCDATTSAFTGGRGTVASPYQVANSTQLARIAQGYERCAFVQTADISLSAIANWTPIGDTARPFRGVYDGDGYAISGMTVTVSDQDASAGLFGTVLGNSRDGVKAPAVLREVRVAGTVSAAVSNFAGGLAGSVQDAQVSDVRSSVAVTGSSGAGGLFGFVNNATVADAAASGAVTGTEFLGGLVGQVSGSTATITRTSATGAVSGDAFVGGLVGQLGEGSIADSYARGAVTAADEYAGGLVGQAFGAIATSYSTGAVTGGVTAGGLAGQATQGATGSFWDTTTSGQTTSDGGTGKATADMKLLATFSGASWSIASNYDTTKTWGLCTLANDGYPYLVASVTVSPCVPAAPTSVSCSAASTTNAVGSISCSFTAPTGTISKYQVSTDAGTTWADLTGTTSPLSFSTQSDGQPLANGLAYTGIRLRAVGATGNGHASSAVSATTTGVPDAPFGVTATAGSGSATLAWSGLPATYLSGPTDSGTVTTPDLTGSTALDQPTSIRALVALADWTPSAATAIAGKGTSLTDASWNVTVVVSGSLRFFFRSGGTTYTAASSVAPTVANGQPLWIRVDRTPSTSTSTVSFFTSLDGSTWTKLGTDRSVATAGAPTDTAYAVSLGSSFMGDRLDGRIYRFTVLSGSTTVADFNATAQTTPTNGDTTITGGNSETWTLTMGTTGAKRARILLTNGGSALTGYRVNVSPSVSGSGTKDTGSTTPGYTFSGLTAATAYSFTVSAMNANGAGAASNSASATPS